MFQDIVDSSEDPTSPLSNSEKRYFDIIGFDPRGVANTLPHLNCFPDAMASNIWMLQTQAEGLVDSNEAAITTIWGRKMAIGKACHEVDSAHESGVGKFMNIPVVVRDMVEIIERHGEWREKETKSVLNTEHIDDIQRDFIQRSKWSKGNEPLLYWGFSSGTDIGGTFASMQPHRVFRMVLDGVSDSVDYFKGQWKSSLILTDKVVQMFFELCYYAGPSRCAFHTGNSPQDIELKLTNIIQELKRSPIAVGASSNRGPSIITYADVMHTIRASVLEPIEGFPYLAELLQDLAFPLRNTSGQLWADKKGNGGNSVIFCPSENCKASGPYSDECQVARTYDASTAIMCSDGPDQSGLSMDDYKTHVNFLKTQSKWVGSSWATTSLVDCIGWKIRPAWPVDPAWIGGQTNHPILLISNRLDPVTPIDNAYTTRSRFEGSRILEIDGMGHCSYAAPSKCANEVVKAYFQRGELPMKGMVCKSDETPFS